MPERTIPFGLPMIDEAERTAVTEVLSGTTLVHGPVTHDFETAFAERCGSRHAISVASCTAGLHLSLLIKEIGPGSKVAVPAMTHVATAHAVEYCGAEPVFIDVEADTGNMDPDALADAAGDGMHAIEVVHYLGLPCDMDRIGAIARKIGAFVVEDCALALDAEYGGRKSGNHGLTGCFSFYPIKHMTSIEGGMVTTNDDSVADAIRRQKAFGYDRTIEQRKKPGIYDVTLLGFNYRMNEVEAAVGLAQMSKLDEFQKKRARNHNILATALADMDEITVFAPTKGKARSSHYCLNAILPRDGSIVRDSVVANLKEAGIGTSVHYPSAVPLFSYYRERYGYRSGQFPIAEWLADQTISLPVGPHITADDAAYIGRAFKNAISKAR